MHPWIQATQSSSSRSSFQITGISQAPVPFYTISAIKYHKLLLLRVLVGIDEAILVSFQNIGNWRSLDFVKTSLNIGFRVHEERNLLRIVHPFMTTQHPPKMVYVFYPISYYLLITVSYQRFTREMRQENARPKLRQLLPKKRILCVSSRKIRFPLSISF